MSDAPAPAATAPPSEYELRGADGRLRGLYDLAALRAMLYTGRIDPRCKVRLPPPGPAWPPPSLEQGDEWIFVGAVPALRQVMDLLGLEPEDGDSERRIAGWQKSVVVDDEDASGTSQDISQVIRASSPPAHQEKLPVVWLVVGTGLLLLVFVVIGLVLS